MKTLKLILAIVLVSLTTTSCDDYLDVENYNGIPADDLVNSVENAQTAVNGVYNGLYGEWLYFYGYYYYTCFATGELDFRASLEDVRPMVNFGYFDGSSAIYCMWKNLYTIVSRANDVQSKIEKLLASGSLTESENLELERMIGECCFLRGWAYFYLTRSFGDKLPSHPGYNPQELGVPILEKQIDGREQLMKGRNTLGECWAEIVSNFSDAYDRLPASWPSAKLGAATKGAAAAYLGRMNMYLEDYTKAMEWFDKALACGNQTGSEYALTEDYAWNFDFNHENNSESVFEIQFQTVSDDTRRASYLWRRLGPDGVGGGFGICNVNLDWVNKFSSGYELTQEVYDKYAGLAPSSASNIVQAEVTKAYAAAIGVAVPTIDDFFKLYSGDWSTLAENINALLKSYKFRLDVTTEPGWGTADSKYIQTLLSEIRAADPRMYDSFYVPGRDIISTNWAGTNLQPYPNSYYGFKKYIPYNAIENWAAEGLQGYEGDNSINQRIFRLADLYLLYAEAAFKTGETKTAAYYLTKVRRRAYKLPFDDASMGTRLSIDYPSADDSADYMDVIVREREKELCLESHLWFDYLRWNMAEKLFASRGFDPAVHHRLPIPLTERQIVGMDVLQQNSGY